MFHYKRITFSFSLLILHPRDRFIALKYGKKTFIRHAIRITFRFNFNVYISKLNCTLVNQAKIHRAISYDKIAKQIESDTYFS